ncbi:unnamed protein product [Schistosoma spindalis]|nr:unnamed protein product [Schistosoma spindale]
MTNKRKRFKPIWSTCFCMNTHFGLFKETNKKLAYFIEKGNLSEIEYILKQIKQPLNNFTLIVKRNQFNTFYPYLINYQKNELINFYQECSPVLWAIDCLQWNVIPLLSYYGFNINCPQICRRWTCIYKLKSKSNNILPYRKFWTKGHYTYQSALDYYFANIYELINENILNYNNNINLLTFYYSHLSNLLTKGIDVHRIDSIIIFNLLAISFNQYLYQYITMNHNLIILKNNQSFIELLIIKKLIKNGYSQFECMDYLYSYCNWFCILLCLLCYPNIDLYHNNNNNNNNIPKMIKQSTLLLINLLVLKCTLPTMEDFNEFIENLPLYKIYIKDYNNKYNEFNKHLIQLYQLCNEFIKKPLSLKLLTRNKIRKSIGGINFEQKINNINLPKQLITFIQYINYEQLINNNIPIEFIKLAKGEWINNIQSTIDCNNNNTTNNNNKLEESINLLHRSNDLNKINNNHYNDEQLSINNILQRGRASERQHINIYQRRINKNQNYKKPLRPTSAPLLRTFVI